MSRHSWRLLFIAIASQLAATQSQPSADVIKAMPTPQAGAVTSVPFSSLPESAQRAMRLDETLSPEGVRIVRGSADRVHMIDNIPSEVVPRGPTDVKLDQTPAFSQMQFLGFLPEGVGTYRATRLWRDRSGTLVMLTEWDYRASGGGITTFSEFQTERVNGMPATLVLVRAPSSSAGMWVMGWTTDRKNYELYVSEPQLADAEIAAHKQVVLGYANAIGE